MRVRITGIPKTKQQVPQVTPFTSPYEMPNPSMKYGGNRPNLGSQNGVPLRVLDTSWDWMKNPVGDGYKEGPYASTGKTLPEAEPGDPDVINAEKQEQVIGDFNGDGMPLLMNVDGQPHTNGGKNVSVPSDSFVFSDTQNLKIKDPEVLKSFGVSKAQTPAKIAKKFDLIAQKKVIDDPDKDELEKRTAQYNYINSVGKLNELASYQENLKAKKNIPNSAGKPMMGQPQRYGGYQDGGFRFDQEPPVNRFEYLGAPQTVYAQRPSEVAGGIGPLQQMPVSIDAFNPPPYSGTMPDFPTMQPVEGDYTTSNGKHGNKHAWNYGRDIINPDQMRNYLLALRAASYPQYQPQRQIAQGAVPQTTFMDPTRALAAIQEGANAETYNASLSGNGPISRAIASSAQGKAGQLGADILSKYNEANVGISNRANEQAANIYNQVHQQQQGYNKEYNEEVANQLKDRFGFQTAIANEYLKGIYADRQRRQSAHNYNYINPFYTMDSQGFIYPKTKEQQKAILGITGTYPGQRGSKEDAAAIAALWQEAKSQNLPDAVAELYVKHHMGQKQRSQYDATGRLKGFTESGFADEDGRPSPYRKYGGPVKKQKMRIVSTP